MILPPKAGIFSMIAALFLAIAPAAQAQSELDLTVTAAHLGDSAHTLSLAELDALEQTSFTTTTIWTDGEIEFSGVALKTLLDHFGITGETVELVALNDYAVSMPLDALSQSVPIVATRMNGAPMSVRDKGPFWVVYPYDSDPKFQVESIYSRSIWQLSQLRIME